MTAAQEKEIAAARWACDQAVKALGTKRGSLAAKNGDENTYALAHRRLARARIAAGEIGYLPIRRRKYHGGM